MIALITLLFGAPLLLPTTDWPRWRGLGQDGVARESDWSNEGQVAWRTNVGLGHSCPSIADGRLYTLGFDSESNEDVLWCLDALSGEEQWTRSWSAVRMADGHGGGTLTTPTVTGDRVYTSSRVGVLRCTDARDGAPLWSVDLPAEYGVEPTRYGFGGSPLVFENLVIVNAARVFAFDAETGELSWYTDDLRAMYSTPTPYDCDEGELLANFTKNGLYLLETDGDIVTSYPWRKGSVSVNAASPVVADGALFISSAYDHGCALLQLRAGELSPAFESKRMRTHMSGAVFTAGALFGFDETRLKCLALDGTERWRKRGLGMGALSASDDRLLIMSEDGELVIASATTDTFHELARRRVFDEGPCWTTPVLVDGRIYCRNGLGELVCLDHSRT